MFKKKTLLRLLSLYEKNLFFFVFVILLIIFSSLLTVFSITYIPSKLSLDLKDIYITAIALLTCFVINIIYSQLIVRISEKLIFNLRSKLIAHTEKMSLSYLNENEQGKIMSYFIENISHLHEFLSIDLIEIIGSFVKIILSIAIIISLNNLIGLIALITSISFIIIYLVFKIISKNKLKNTKKNISNLNSQIQEDIYGLKVIKAFNYREGAFLKFNELNNAYKDSSSISSKFILNNNSISKLISIILFGITFAILLFIKSDIGALSICTILFIFISINLNIFTNNLESSNSALTSVKMIFDYLDTKEEADYGVIELINDSNVFKWKIPLKDGTTKFINLKGDVKFKNVSFEYTKDKPILKNVSFEIKDNKKLAIVGPTGAGKTTIIALLLRFYNISEGEITYDGLNIKDIKIDSLRKAMSVVNQDTHLFTSSIKDNIRYGDMSINEIEVEKISKITLADNFISKLPNCYETMLYENGSNLSEGQRQLISLTRSAAIRPPLLILDEATSSIDTYSEKAINKAMFNIMKERTVIVIAHRLSTVENADEIIVLDNGEIKEKGTHKDLMKTKGYYYNLQKGKKELD